MSHSREVNHDVECRVFQRDLSLFVYEQSEPFLWSGITLYLYCLNILIEVNFRGSLWKIK